MSEIAADRAQLAEDLVASGRQIDMRFRQGHKVLTARARKLWHLLVKNSASALAEDKKHKVNLSNFREIGHTTHKQRMALINELQSTFVIIDDDDPDGSTRMGSLIADVKLDKKETGSLTYKFSDTVRDLFASSPTWAILEKRVVMSFESKYALALYEIVSLRINLKHIKSEVFEITDLRDRLGVPHDRYANFADVRRYVLELGIAEVNQLADFTLKYEPIKTGRAVTHIKLSWKKKADPDLLATRQEREKSRVGRKARRDGTVEALVEQPLIPEAFPEGTIRGTSFEHVAREHLPKPLPDLDLVARRFRSWADRKRIPLSGSRIMQTFVGFCQKEHPVG